MLTKIVANNNEEEEEEEKLTLICIKLVKTSPENSSRYSCKYENIKESGIKDLIWQVCLIKNTRAYVLIFAG